MKCENCIHFEVCSYVSHLLPSCDSYAEPQVRCKDCKAWQTKNAMSFLRNGIHVRCCPCDVLGRLMYDDDFCSKGKRRTGQ